MTRSAGMPVGHACAPRVARPRAAAGFTLIEVLLATVLLAAGLALAFATIRGAQAVSARGEAMAAASERQRAVEGFLRSRLESARPLAFATDPGTQAPLRFLGTPTSMEFVADLPDYLGRGGPAWHKVEAVRSDRGWRLEASFALVQGGQTIEEQPPRPPELLADDLSEVAFRYRGLDDDGQPGDWQDTWTQADRLPILIEVRIRGERDGAWPTLLVAPRAVATDAVRGQL